MLSIRCEFGKTGSGRAHTQMVPTVAYHINTIVAGDLVIGGFQDSTLKRCESIAIAQGIAGHVIIDALTTVANKLTNNSNDVRTTNTFTCTTELKPKGNDFIIENDADMEGEVTVKTADFGTIILGISNVIIPRDKLVGHPDQLMINAASEKLTEAMKTISLEADALRSQLDGQELALRKIATATELPQSVLDRIR